MPCRATASRQHHHIEKKDLAVLDEGRDDLRALVADRGEAVPRLWSSHRPNPFLRLAQRQTDRAAPDCFPKCLT